MRCEPGTHQQKKFGDVTHITCTLQKLQRKTLYLFSIQKLTYIYHSVYIFQIFSFAAKANIFVRLSFKSNSPRLPKGHCRKYSHKNQDDLLENIDTSWYVLRNRGIRSISLLKHPLDLFLHGNSSCFFPISLTSSFLPFIFQPICLKIRFLSVPFPLHIPSGCGRSWLFTTSFL